MTDITAQSYQTDILIIGGGPAGLLCAEAVASRGISTLLVEQESMIGCPVHTSGATSVMTMQEFGIPKHLYHPINRIRICSENETAVFDYSEPTGCIIDVSGVYQFLAERARGKGATILTGTRATEPILDNSFVGGSEVIRDGHKAQVRSKVTVDASGYRSLISKAAGLHHGFRRFGVGVEYDLRAPKCRQDEAVLIVGNRYAPSGYGWVFPWGSNRVRVGVGLIHADSSADPRDHLKIMLKGVESFSVDLSDYQITEEHYGLVPSDGVAKHLAGNGIMAVGDAGGQASLVVGEGIRLCMRAGQLAGKTAAEAIIEGKWDCRSLMPYERAFRAFYGRNLAIGHMINVRIARWSDRKWDEQVRILKDVPTDMLADLLQSEFSLGKILGWLALRPYFWPKAIRYTIKGLLTRVRLP